METGRVALIRYIAPDGVKSVASGLLVSDRHVLTADHVAKGSLHVVSCTAGDFEVTAMLRSFRLDIDLAVLTLNDRVTGLGQLPYARVDRSQMGRVTGCITVGFPRWKKAGVQRRTAQLDGCIPTAEGLEPDADSGLRAGFLTLVGDRLPAPGAPAIACGALHEESRSPWGGMSGAGVVTGDLVIGVVRSHNLAAGGQSVTVTPITAVDNLPPELRREFCAVLGIADPHQLPMLPSPSVRTWSGLDPAELSPDVQDAFRLKLGKTCMSSDFPARWTLEGLSGFRRKLNADGQGASKVADGLTALCEALVAKPVFSSAGGGRLGLGQLQVTYRHEVGAWPDGNSADALLVEAASAWIAERRPPSGTGPLGALARFVIGVAAAVESLPADSDLMMHWIGSLGHQAPDAQAHYEQRRDRSAWLVIDLGDEPPHGASQWPTSVAWTLLTSDDLMTGDPVPCEATPDALRQALTHILRLVPPAHPLLVDLAVPRALMDEGIEHWPVLEVDGAAEPLSRECQPRLRWSRRRRDIRLHNRLVDRISQASWDGEARHWLQNDPRRACFLGGRALDPHEDQLRGLLREGCGFAIWFASGMPDSAVPQITRAIRDVPVAARRATLPDQLPDISEGHPVVIWDDPQGRARFRLPRLAALESP